ncbi:MAG: 30S ribosomal protein S18 [Acidobacteria bacterium]|nr:MAG: 30S ribosomal protein S18 [Acidobacteriota bacterium]REK01308.1 MAG: 30S ribosomal protein S18 [Acidobacteriota bacterium]REK14264.1 MAG: 30S ribosomal protein S18 [Acidobacteriota bacterium]REK44979.1 MAG: 30S ribosomal protein S18 [Acidobacteriota bacterium]
MAEKEEVKKKESEDSGSSKSASDSRSERPKRPPRRQNFRRYNRRRQRQSVPAYVDWKDVEFLERFIPERGKIMPRRISGVSAKDQRRVARAIKRARVMALIPYVSD